MVATKTARKAAKRGVEVVPKKTAVDMYKQAELEKTLWESRLEGMSDDQLASMVGLPTGVVSRTLGKMLQKVQTDAASISRAWALRQTMALWTEIYSVAAEEWLKTRDPRYAEVMRGALADIRKIWGVDAPQRAIHGHVVAGVIHTKLGGLSKDELEYLSQIFPTGGDDAGSYTDGSGIQELAGVCEDGD